MTFQDFTGGISATPNSPADAVQQRLAFVAAASAERSPTQFWLHLERRAHTGCRRLPCSTTTLSKSGRLLLA